MVEISGAHSAVEVPTGLCTINDTKHSSYTWLKLACWDLDPCCGRDCIFDTKSDSYESIRTFSTEIHAKEWTQNKSDSYKYKSIQTFSMEVNRKQWTQNQPTNIDFDQKLGSIISSALSSLIIRAHNKNRTNPPVQCMVDKECRYDGKEDAIFVSTDSSGCLESTHTH